MERSVEAESVAADHATAVSAVSKPSPVALLEGTSVGGYPVFLEKGKIVSRINGEGLGQVVNVAQSWKRAMKEGIWVS